MRHSLHSHIIYLENTIQDLKNRLTRVHLCIEEFEDLQLQLATAESALTHYRQAYELELSVAGSEPPSQPDGAKSDGGADRPEISKPEKKNGLRGRKRARLIRSQSRILRIPHHTALNGSRRTRPSKV
jgi:hypothetical protein